MEKQHKTEERIVKLIELISYAQAGLEKAQKRRKKQIKRLTCGDLNAQFALLNLNNKPNIAKFKPFKQQ